MLRESLEVFDPRRFGSWGLLVDCANQGIVQELGETLSILGQSTDLFVVGLGVVCIWQDRQDFAPSGLGRCGQLGK